MDGRGSCVSIADSLGNLLFYAHTYANSSDTSTYIYNYLNNVVSNGHGIIGEGWYNELIIVPMPESANKYYLFSIGVAAPFPPYSGLFYSIIDMNLNGGQGSVISKNNLLFTFNSMDGISAIKHGNGRDWWVVVKKDGYHNPPNNDFYVYLITPYGISSPSVQSLGYTITTNGGCISFNKQGNKMLMTDLRNLIQLFDFDRCTGVLSNANIIEPEHVESGEHFGSCFSPDGNKIYITHPLDGASMQDSWLYQFDLTASNIAASRDTLYHGLDPEVLGTVRLAPDDKVYLSMGYYAYYFPFPDSMYYPQNMNLSVINRPDSLGDSCLFAPYSFYLGGKRTYWGLPNNPDYELGPLVGSNCDTVLAVNRDIFNVNSSLHVFYHSGWQMAFINGEGLRGRNYVLGVYDLMGRDLYKEEGKTNGDYFTKDLNCEQFARGMYVVRLQTEREMLMKKFVKE